jgi:hypothetical protein
VQYDPSLLSDRTENSGKKAGANCYIPDFNASIVNQGFFIRYLIPVYKFKESSDHKSSWT